MGLGHDQQQHPAVYSGGVSRRSLGWSVAVGDMWQVTGDRPHMTPDT